MDGIQISVITVCMNHLKYIRELYRSLYADESGPKVLFEAIYVDNCSTDGSVEFLKKNYPQVIIIQNKEPYGFGKNNNIGAEVAKGKYLAIINPDIKVKPGSLDALYRYMEANPGVGMSVPHLFNADGTHQYSIRGFITPSLFIARILTHGKDSANNPKMKRYLCKDIDVEKEQPINWAVGASLFLPKALFRKVGGFDLDYFLYMEDEDLALKVWKSGHPVMYVPTSQMIQGALLITGNHDYTKSDMPYRNAPIKVEDGAWIGANATVTAGVTVAENSVLTVGAVATHNTEPNMIYQGNPAKPIRERHITE